MKNTLMLFALITVCSSMFPFRPKTCSAGVRLSYYKKGKLVKVFFVETKFWMKDFDEKRISGNEIFNADSLVIQPESIQNSPFKIQNKK